MDTEKQIQSILQLYKNKNYNKASSICEKIIRKNDKILIRFDKIREVKSSCVSMIMKINNIYHG